MSDCLAEVFGSAMPRQDVDSGHWNWFLTEDDIENVSIMHFHDEYLAT